jgi:hypothetical protein
MTHQGSSPQDARDDRSAGRSPCGGARARDEEQPSPGRGSATGKASRTRDPAVVLEARARFLAEASRVLASSLDVDATLAAVARLAVPMLGDWCLIDLADDGRVRRVTVAHADSDRDGPARVLERLGPDDEPIPCGAPHALRTGSTELTTSITDADLAAGRAPASAPSSACRCWRAGARSAHSRSWSVT